MSRNRHLTNEEKQIWKQVTAECNRLKHERKTGENVAPKPIKLRKLQSPTDICYSPIRNSEFDARLDLHGMTAVSAHKILLSFIREQIKLQNRYLLVITGKGSGTLRDALPHWLDIPDLQGVVASIEVAKPKHGGTGAYYISLRRTRENTSKKK